MRLLRNGLIAFVSVSLTFALIFALLGYQWSREAWPQVAGNMRVAGLAANVEVLRDIYGVPHIYADTPEDLFRAQGLVHAQERFFQMEFWRRVGQGRLSELFGKSTLDQDRFIRTVGFHRAAELDLPAMTNATKLALEAYADGVNAYMLPRAAEPASLALEFRVLGLLGRTIKLDPWLPIHTLTWQKVMAWDLKGDSLDNELLNSAILKQGGADLLRALRPNYPADMPVIVPSPRLIPTPPVPADDGHVSPDIADAALDLLAQIKSFDDLIGHEPSNGSNNWVVHGSRSSTGRPLLANDPHLGIQMPSIWFQIGLHCRVVNDACPYDVAGVSFAGVPGVVIGHNQRIAWGVTNAGPDVQDLYIERPDPNNPDAFEYLGKYEPARVIDEVINIAGEPQPVIQRVRMTRHGPIMNDVQRGLREDPRAQKMALRWTALQANSLTDAILGINRARGWDEFRQALRAWDAPAQNFVYADILGNIGYQMPGKIPMRQSGNGDLPVPGWTAEFEWINWVPFDALPVALNPPEAAITSANNPVSDLGYPHFLGNDFDFGYRARRINAFFQTRTRFSMGDLRAIQDDSESGLARDTLRTIYNALGNQPFGDALNQQAWTKLMAWDWQSRANSSGALIWETFWNRLAHHIFDDELGPEVGPLAIGTGSATRIAVRNMIFQPQNPYWDDLRTPIREGAAEIMLRAFVDSTARISAKHGANPDTWRWGDAHTATFKNATLGSSGVALIERMFNRGPFPVDGATSAINANSHGENMEVRSVPSLRMLIDVADWDNSLLVHTTGQSGHPYHRQYDSYIQTWRATDYNHMFFARRAVENNLLSKMTLTP